MWVWALMQTGYTARLIQVFCGRIFSLTTLAERPPGWTGARLHSLLTMLTRVTLAAVMLLALSSVALSSVAVTSTDDSSEGKRLMTMWANHHRCHVCVLSHSPYLGSWVST